MYQPIDSIDTFVESSGLHYAYIVEVICSIPVTPTISFASFKRKDAAPLAVVVGPRYLVMARQGAVQSIATVIRASHSLPISLARATIAWNSGEIPTPSTPAPSAAKSAKA